MEQTGLKMNPNTGMRVLDPEVPAPTPEVKADARALSNEASQFILQSTTADKDGRVTLPPENPDIVAERATDSVPDSKFVQFAPEEKPF
jgi:5-hydroxyisourate hydrolase-like protein (transthyretin family)